MPAYRIENAATGRAKCKATTCGNAAIAKGELRFGTWVELAGHGSFHWKHWGCATAKVIGNLKESLKDGENLNFERCDGYDELNSDGDREVVKEAIERGYVADENWRGPPNGNRPITPKTSKKNKAAENENGDVEGATVPKTKGVRGGKTKKAGAEKLEKKSTGKASTTVKPGKIVATDSEMDEPISDDKDVPKPGKNMSDVEEPVSGGEQSAADKKLETLVKKPDRTAKKSAKGSKSEVKAPATAKTTKAKPVLSRASARARPAVSYGDQEDLSASAESESEKKKPAPKRGKRVEVEKVEKKAVGAEEKPKQKRVRKAKATKDSPSEQGGEAEILKATAQQGKKDTHQTTTTSKDVIFKSKRSRKAKVVEDEDEDIEPGEQEKDKKVTNTIEDIHDSRKTLKTNELPKLKLKPRPARKPKVAEAERVDETEEVTMVIDPLEENQDSRKATATKGDTPGDVKAQVDKPKLARGKKNAGPGAENRTVVAAGKKRKSQGKDDPTEESVEAEAPIELIEPQKKKGRLVKKKVKTNIH